MHLSRNLLSGAIPAGIRNCVGLISFTADFNRLEGKIPPEIFELSCLIELLLDHNQLTGEIPENAGEKTPNLLKFRCNNNRLTGPLPTFKHSLKLKYLNLSENEFLC
ncbi:hypothetical protein BDR26DRAFT_863208 [Obelidium mucronatum]|nr:hypothetical protein BDR26DRAFT_863208 [Obelidium mucronatum]